jgi:hypothetical protein
MTIGKEIINTLKDIILTKRKSGYPVLEGRKDVS